MSLRQQVMTPHSPVLPVWPFKCGIPVGQALLYLFGQRLVSATHRMLSVLICPFRLDC